MRKFVLSAAVIGIVLGATACKECKKTYAEVIEPTQALAPYLGTIPSGQELAGACPMIQEKIKDIPDGAQMIRDLARDKFLSGDSPLPPPPAYEQAITLSQDLDEFYQLAQTMCADATAGRFDAAYGESIAATDILLGKIMPEEEGVYKLACSQ